MNITVAGATYAVHRPDDLDGQLIAATGMSAQEHLDSFGPATLPGTLARFVRPFLAADAPCHQALAIGLEGDLARDRAGTLAAVRALAAAKPAKVGEGKPA